MKCDEMCAHLVGKSYFRRNHIDLQTITSFDSIRKPHVHINEYYERFLRHTNCEKCIVDVVWIYLQRIVHKIEIHEYNIHRLLSQAFNIALKFLDDDHMCSKRFCNIAGYSYKEFQHLESEFLLLLEYNCMAGIPFKHKEFVG